MSIPAANPVVVPATGAATYNLLWVSYLQVTAGDPTRPVRLVAEIRKARDTDGKGTLELAPSDVDGAKGSLVIKDLFAEMAGDPDSATIVTALLNKIKALAEAAKVI